VSEAAKIDDKEAKRAAKDACPKGSSDEDDDGDDGDGGDDDSGDADGARGSCVSEAAKIDDKEAKRAAKDACPKGSSDEDGDGGDGGGDDSVDAAGRSDDAPGRSGDAPGKSGDAPKGGGNAKHDDDPCRGRPVWAGPMSKEERAALKEANSRDLCVDDEVLDDDTDDTDDDD
jgi:hypothetical protein